MQVIELSSVANQSITVTPETYQYTIVVRYFRDMMYAFIYDSFGNQISSATRCCNGKWLIPYGASNYDGAGNFMFVDQDRKYPDFRNFGKTCSLVYYTREEITNGETV